MLAILLCCVSIGLISNTLAATNHTVDTIESIQEKAISTFSTKLFCHTSPSESAFANATSTPAPSSKNISSGFRTLAKAIEKRIEAASTQYLSYTREILINQRKSDILFPFHYFW